MHQPPLSKSEFSERAEVIARRIIQALEGEQDAFLVLEGLSRVHRFVCMQLPADALGAAGFAMGVYAGELMKASATGKGLGANNSIH